MIWSRTIDSRALKALLSQRFLVGEKRKACSKPCVCWRKQWHVIRRFFGLSANWHAYIDLQYRHVKYNINGFPDNRDLFIRNGYNFFNPRIGISYVSNDWGSYLSYSIAHTMNHFQRYNLHSFKFIHCIEWQALRIFARHVFAYTFRYQF